LFLLHLCFDNSKDILFFSQFIVPLLWSFGGAVRVDHAQEEENSVMADSGRSGHAEARRRIAIVEGTMMPDRRT
jgi:hypothetical protein